jgi:hypothetical protein
MRRRRGFRFIGRSPLEVDAAARMARHETDVPAVRRRLVSGRGTIGRGDGGHRRGLRREVDGQGLTERVRLTPLGRDSIADWRDTIPPAGPLTRLSHWLRQHRPHL